MANKPKRFDTGIILDPICAGPNASCCNPTCNTEGMLWVLCCTLRAYVGAAVRDVVTTTQTQTLSGKTVTSPVLNGCLSGTAFLDEDGFCSNSDTKVASQQSIKAYVDAQLTTSSLCFTDDCCTACLSIDLDSETLKIAGSGGVTTSAACNTITVALGCTLSCKTLADVIIGSVNPTINFKDSNGAVSDVNASIDVNLTCTGCGTECADISIKTQICGTMTEVIKIDADGDVIINKALDLCGQLKLPAGAVCSPAVQIGGFQSGFYNSSSSRISLSINSSEKVRWENGAAVHLMPVGINHPCQSSTVPGLAKSNDLDTGLSFLGCNTWNGISASTQIFEVSGGDTFDFKVNPTVNGNAVTDRLDQADIKFYECSCNGCNYIAFKAPDSVTANTTFKWPDGDGTNGQVLSTDSCGNLSWASAGGGNLIIMFCDFSADDCSKITTYDDCSAATDLTGGCCIHVTKGLETCNPLYGTSSYKLTKDAANRIHEGWSIAADSIPRITSVGGKKVNVSFVYETSANYASGDIKMYAYRVGSNKLEQLYMQQGSTWSSCLQAAPCGGEFISSITLGPCDTGLRIGFHVNSANASAYCVVVDAVDISASRKVQTSIYQYLGSISLSGGWCCNTTYSAIGWRNGDKLVVHGKVNLTGSPGTPGALSLTIPYTVDNSKIIDCVCRRQSIGRATFIDNTGANYTGFVSYNCTNTIVLSVDDGDSTYSTVTHSNPFTWACADKAVFCFELPICGWSTGTLLSTQEMVSKTLKFEATLACTFNVCACTGTRTIPFCCIGYSTHGAGVLGTGCCAGKFIAPFASYYKVRTMFRPNSVTADSLLTASIISDTRTEAQYFYSDNYTGPSVPLEKTVYLDTGEAVWVTISSSDGTYTVDGAVARSWFQVESCHDLSVYTSYGNGLGDTKTYTCTCCTATWTKPANLRAIKVTVVGGGGAGGGAAATTACTNMSAGSGGGGGGTAIKWILAACLGATETVTVGAGGSGNSGANGCAGSTSSFGCHVSATGGDGGLRLAANSVGSVAGAAGGSGACGDQNIAGQGGGAGFGELDKFIIGGTGGSSNLGGGSPAKRSNAAGSSGGNYGGGGSGAANNDGQSARAGGNGAGGVVIVEEYY